MSALKEKTSIGLFWSLADSFGVYFIKLIFSIYIARLLLPGDYGIMGMIIIFISLGQLFMQGGFSMALIRKKDADQTDFSTVFWFNLISGLVVYLTLFLIAGPIARFFNTPLLENITRIAALSIVINSLGAIQAVKLSRELDFRKQAGINLFASLLSGVAGVTLAIKGFGVWALVGQTVTGSIFHTAGLWIAGRWIPRFDFSSGSFSGLFSYGYKIFLQGLSDILFTRIYFPLIGKLFPVEQLGFYTNANRFYELFVRQVSSSVGRVVFPAFSSVSDQKEKFVSNYIKGFSMLSLGSAFLMTLLILTAPQFIEILLTAKWLPVVPLMVIFFIEGFYFPLFMYNQNLICSLGFSGASLKIDILRRGMSLASILIAFKFGIAALIIGQITVTFISFIHSSLFLMRNLGIDLRHIITGILPVIIMTGMSILISMVVLDSLLRSPYLLLLIKIVIIPLFFILISRLFRLSSYRELKSLILQNLKAGKK